MMIPININPYDTLTKLNTRWFLEIFGKISTKNKTTQRQPITIL
jgi:hypothetical protein